MSTVDTKHPQYTFMAPQWKKARATASGQRAVKELGETVLPRLKDQIQTDYDAYKMRASFVNFVWRTVSALAGMIFRKDPDVEVPASIEAMLEDITGTGVDFHVFAQQVTIEDLITGRLGVLVDHPEQATEGLTVADTQAMNIRPTMQLYKAETISNWRTGRVNNQTVPVEIRLMEDHTDPAKGFENPETEVRYRVLDLVTRPIEDGEEDLGPVYRVRVFRINDNKDDEQVGPEIFPLMNGKPLSFIPFYSIGVDDTTLDMDEPPLIDLVEVNLDHYRLSADLKHGLHYGGLPTPVISGYTPENKDEKLYVGSPSAWVFPDPNAKASYLEYTGQGLEPIAKEMTADEERMAILGARMLASERKSTETAQAARIYRAGESSILSAMAATISIGLSKALTTFCEWAGADGECSIQLNDEFVPPEVSPEEFGEWLKAWMAGAPGFSDQGFLSILQHRELIAKDVTLEEEQARIGERRPATPDE